MLKRNVMVASLMAVATFSGLALSAFAIDDAKPLPNVAASTDILDSAIAEKVENLLKSDVGLAGSQFRVASKAAVVTIGGSVPDEHALRRALDLASSVRGVREVRNAMEVEIPK